MVRAKIIDGGLEILDRGYVWLGAKIMESDLKILERGYIWLGLRSWIVILRSWDVDTYKVRVEILYGDFVRRS